MMVVVALIGCALVGVLVWVVVMIGVQEDDCNCRDIVHYYKRDNRCAYCGEKLTMDQKHRRTGV